MKKQKSEYSIQTVANAFKLLEAFRDEEELGVTELSRRLELHKNNVFRLLATLELLGYVEQSCHSDRYRLGAGCLDLGQFYLRSRSLLRHARPLLEEIAERSGESAHLAVMGEFDVVHLDGVGSDQLVGGSVRIGSRLPVHCTALGKVLLGCSPETVHREFDRRRSDAAPLASRTPATIVDSQKLFDQLRSASLRGYAVDLEECVPGLACAAAPVYDNEGAVVAAISVSGPAFRMTEARLLDEIVPLVVDAAARLSRELGFSAQAQGG
jgi:DNA-binding IclR family transcriptional regulator